MWIKICGNTNIEDAQLAAELGADAVGFVLAESARQVTSAQVAEIVSQLPDSIEKIGVFSSHDANEIARTVRETRLTGVQLHGRFDLALARRLNAEFGESVVLSQVVHWQVDQPAESEAEIVKHLKSITGQRAVHRVLVDSKTKSGSGGTGESFDWAAARAALSEASGLDLIVAGGLHSENVARAIAALHPWGVDVVSGVEASKGRKDPRKLKAFIAAARGLQERNQAGPG